MVNAQIGIHPVNDTNKLLLDFDIQTYHLISARWPDLVIVKKKKKKKEPAENKIKRKPKRDSLT